jgi:hypothetical protein
MKECTLPLQHKNRAPALNQRLAQQEISRHEWRHTQWASLQISLGGCTLQLGILFSPFLFSFCLSSFPFSSFPFSSFPLVFPFFLLLLYSTPSSFFLPTKEILFYGIIFVIFLSFLFLFFLPLLFFFLLSLLYFFPSPCYSYSSTLLLFLLHSNHRFSFNSNRCAFCDLYYFQVDIFLSTSLGKF